MVKRKWMDPDNISEHLHCAMCMDVFDEPVCGRCGHSFCKSCYDDWLRQHDTCPTCRAKVQRKHLHKDITAERFLNDLVVRCDHLGCAWDGSIEQLKSHVKECEHHPDRVPDWVKQNGDRVAPVDANGEKSKGISSLRLRLFKDPKAREALKSAAGGHSSGECGILSVDESGVLTLDD
jgi:hypothetical protein